MINDYYVELWSGEESFSKYARSQGIECKTLDNDSSFNPTLCGDILDESIQNQIMVWITNPHCLGVWMSPVCTFWSLSAGNTYWTKYRMPRNEKTIIGIKMM
jgi:hypothetical protein